MRKIVNVIPDKGCLYVICDDGTLWGMSSNMRWVEYPAIPQPPEVKPKYGISRPLLNQLLDQVLGRSLRMRTMDELRTGVDDAIAEVIALQNYRMESTANNL